MMIGGLGILLKLEAIRGRWQETQRLDRIHQAKDVDRANTPDVDSTDGSD